MNLESTVCFFFYPTKAIPQEWIILPRFFLKCFSQTDTHFLPVASHLPRRLCLVSMHGCSGPYAKPQQGSQLWLQVTVIWELYVFFMPRTHPILINPESLGMGCKSHNMFPGGPPRLSRVPWRCTRERNSAIFSFGFPMWWVRSGHALLEDRTWVAGCSFQTSCEHILYSLTDSSAKPLLCPLFLTVVWPAIQYLGSPWHQTPRLNIQIGFSCSIVFTP